MHGRQHRHLDGWSAGSRRRPRPRPIFRHLQGEFGFAEWYDAFLEHSRPYVDGWISFYHAAIDDSPDAAVPDEQRAWLDRFRAGPPPASAREPEPPPALDQLELAASPAARDEAIARWRVRERQGVA